MRLAFFLIIVAKSTFSQNLEPKKLGLHGTLIIAAIGTDGIMIAADSRTILYFNNPRENLAYFDGAEKITTIKHYGVGVVGVAEVEGKSAIQIIKEYESSSDTNLDLSYIPYDFGKYLIHKLTNVQLQDLKNNLFIFCGYANKEAKIIGVYLEKDTFGVVSANHYLISDRDASRYFKYNSKLNSFQLGQIAKKAIYEFALKEGKKETIGGEISILKVNSNNSYSWIKKVGGKWHTFKDFFNLYFKGKVKIHYLQSNAKHIIDSTYRNLY